MAESESLTRRQVADRYGISRSGVYDWVEMGLPPHARRLRSWAITRTPSCC